MELISREEAMEAVRAIKEVMLTNGEVINALYHVPTIESRPKGKWIDKRGNTYCCSNCDSQAGYYVGNPFGEYKIFQHLSDYCPDCGAEMKEDGEE